ncbi:hypothetical protein PsorP6_000147 [Peronosclerospora sorghi]|uniref:Uncharacterized protein n=1 Tax=Peronosclerospora sorghi TaxID=230839 RepID=A0ACC0WVQ9_9STRA|nr:hypothetical protein PsorP6_000147 [Peronosclerospora sorghi]
MTNKNGDFRKSLRSQSSIQLMGFIDNCVHVDVDETTEEEELRIRGYEKLIGFGAIGFTYFDISMNLLGFYQEGRENATTEVVFVPVSDIPAISQGEIHETQRLAQAEMKTNSSAVHTLARCNNDLVKLKEDVILFHWNAKDRINPNW